MASNNDALKMLPDGRCTLTLGGKTHTLRRPIIGEQWRFDDLFLPIQQAERADTEWAVEKLGDVDTTDENGRTNSAAVLRAVRNVDPEETMKRNRARQTMLLEWWVAVIETLAPEGFTMPPIEDLPPFFLDYALVTKVRTGWAMNPADPGDE